MIGSTRAAPLPPSPRISNPFELAPLGYAIWGLDDPEKMAEHTCTSHARKSEFKERGGVAR